MSNIPRLAAGFKKKIKTFIGIAQNCAAAGSCDRLFRFPECPTSPYFYFIGILYRLKHYKPDIGHMRLLQEDSASSVFRMNL
jgi:hypothetical protein